MSKLECVKDSVTSKKFFGGKKTERVSGVTIGKDYGEWEAYPKSLFRPLN